MPVGEHISRDPVTVDPGASIRDAAKQMEVLNSGCVIAVSEAGRPLGVLTDRDIAVRVLRKGLDPDATTVSSVMDDETSTLRESATLTNAMRRMRSSGVRRLPVVDRDGVLIGVFDWNDAVQIIAAELQQAGRVAGAQS
jgi:CBS domain-containing protein